MINPSQRSDCSMVAETMDPSLDSLSTEEFLRIVGLRVRSQRSTMSMSRKRLAEVSGVSERYLAQLESGQGNMSIALLRKVTTAIGMSLATLLSAETPELSSAPNRSMHGSLANSSHDNSGHETRRRDDDLPSRSSHLVTEPEI
ncbi:MAG: helix-turn-helix domain-containing protein [Granulosicoccus sp.]